MYRTATSAAITVLAATALAAAAAPAGAAPNGPSAWPTGKSIITSEGVIQGKISAERGNQHQVVLSSTDRSVSGHIRSWYCPTGVKVTSTWAPKSCTHRGTMKALDAGRFDDDNNISRDIHWVSSTGKSARQNATWVNFQKKNGTLAGFYVGFLLYDTDQDSLATLSGIIGPEGDEPYTFTPRRGWITVH